MTSRGVSCSTAAVKETAEKTAATAQEAMATAEAATKAAQATKAPAKPKTALAALAAKKPSPYQKPPAGFQPKLGPSPIKPAKQKIEMPTGEHTLRGGMYFPRQEGDARCDVCKTFRPSMALEHNHGGYQCIEAQVDP